MAARDRRPLVLRTSGSATEGVYGLILATAVIALSRELDPSDAGRAAVNTLLVALVFWLAHVYAGVLGRAVSDGRSLSGGAISEAMREHWSLVEVAVPLVLVLGLGVIDVVPDRAALTAATALALVELTATGAYAAIEGGAGRLATFVSALTALGLGLLVVLLKVLVH